MLGSQSTNRAQVDLGAVSVLAGLAALGAAGHQEHHPVGRDARGRARLPLVRDAVPAEEVSSRGRTLRELDAI